MTNIDSTVSNDTIRLTMAQALVKYLTAQYISTETGEEALFSGAFAIFGHGNVSCIGEALYQAQPDLPTFRGQNEQAMAIAGISYAKAKLRRKIMVATSSIGPGATNMVTAAAIAHTNRLPILLLSGDNFSHRFPDPVLQQVEHFNQPSLSVSDAFKSVTRYWDRITHPAQLLQSLPNAVQTLLDPTDCGPAFLALPQDVQAVAYDFPTIFFEKHIHKIRRQPACQQQLEDALPLLLAAKKPLIIAGGGVQYSLATDALADFAEKHQIPVVETIAGRANMLFEHPLNCGPIGVTGSNSANNLAKQADIILALGTRLQDFTTGSWSAFSQTAKIISLNVGRFDASKHLSVPIIGDIKTVLPMLSAKMCDFKSEKSWLDIAKNEVINWNAYISEHSQPADYMSYAQVIRAVNDHCDDDDRIVAAAGGLPAEVAANWRTKSHGSVDIEFGFSCMGYEIAGGWGARIAQMEDKPDNDTIVFVGDGSYMMMNSDIYSSVLTNKKMIIIVCDNGGFAVINKLQNNTGNASFNNLIKDCNIETKPFSVDFAQNAISQGALAENVTSINGLIEAFKRAKLATKTYVICLKVDSHQGWTKEGHTWWQVGIPEVSSRKEVLEAGHEMNQGIATQRKGV